MPSVNAPLPPTLRATALRTAVLIATATALGACTSTGDALSGDKIDYRSKATKTAPLDVPPDLTQLQRDSRYSAPTGTGTGVSASALQTAAAAPASAAAGGEVVAPTSVGDMHIERAGNQRWLVVPMAADKLWPQLRAFWQERGFKLTIDDATAGVMETEWAENRANIPQDVIRRTLGRVFDSLYDSGERDRFRLRVERNGSGSGSDIFISHRGMVEVYTSKERDQTRWTPRPSDPQLEAEMLTRLMVKLGAKDETARAVAAHPVTEAPRAQALSGQPAATLRIDEGFDRAWRRVGLALDRSGFTVEDRDRAGGLYFVRYIDPQADAAGEPGFFAKLFGGAKPNAAQDPSRYRIAVKADGEQHTTVTVLNAQGGPENGDVAQRIVTLLVEDLK
jgi:outer membrane protein assembly factor BamC